MLLVLNLLLSKLPRWFSLVEGRLIVVQATAVANIGRDQAALESAKVLSTKVDIFLINDTARAQEHHV